MKTEIMECQVVGCSRKVARKKRRLCAAHNARWMHYGDLYADVPIKQGANLAVQRKALQAKPGKRRCQLCKKQKKIEEFNGRVCMCKPCARDAGLRKVYGIGTQDYDKMLKKQKGKCALCGTKNTGKKNFFSVDHNHKTGKIRGLLCNTCNTSLGCIEKRKIPIARLARYLKK